jgi:hypothetical protein
MDPKFFPVCQFYDFYPGRAAAKLAKEVAAEGGALTLGGVSQCPSYLSGMAKEVVQAEFRKQVKVFVEEDLDFLLCEVSLTFLRVSLSYPDVFLQPDRCPNRLCYRCIILNIQ